MGLKKDGKAASLLVGHVAATVREEIRCRNLAAGDPICTEVELAERLGISRNIVREGVSRLRTLGVVTSRRGKGLVVARSDPAALLRDSLGHYATDRESLGEIAELRYSIETGAIDFAVARATPEQVARLKELGDEFAKLASAKAPGQIAELDAIDREFHLLILEATRSELLRDMHAVLCAYWDRVTSTIPDYVTYDAGLSWEHQAIAQAFGERDVLQARVVLSNHLLRMVERVAALSDERSWMPGDEIARSVAGAPQGKGPA